MAGDRGCCDYMTRKRGQCKSLGWETNEGEKGNFRCGRHFGVVQRRFLPGLPSERIPRSSFTKRGTRYRRRWIPENGVAFCPKHATENMDSKGRKRRRLEVDEDLLSDRSFDEEDGKFVMSDGSTSSDGAQSSKAPSSTGSDIDHLPRAGEARTESDIDIEDIGKYCSSDAAKDNATSELRMAIKRV